MNSQATAPTAGDRPAVSLVHRDPPVLPYHALRHLEFALAGVVAFVITLAVLAAVNGGSILLTIDEPITNWIVERRTPAWEEFFDRMSRLGDNELVFAFAAVLAVVTWFRCRYLAVALILAAAFRPPIEFVLKAVVDRERPDIEPLRDFAGPSHPSGHPLAAAAFWGLLPAVVAMHVRSRILWWISVVTTITIVTLVAASRVYIGAHWFTDVAASLGWAAVYLLAVQGVFEKAHLDRDCRHSQHATQSG